MRNIWDYTVNSNDTCFHQTDQFSWQELWNIDNLIYNKFLIPTGGHMGVHQTLHTV